MFPVLFVQSEIGCAADDLFRIVPVDISVPVVEKERHAPLMLPDGHTHRFGFIIMNEKIWPAPVLVRVQSHEKGIERTDGHAARMELGIAFAGCVQPIPVCVRGSVQGFGKQVYLLPLCIFLYGWFFFHTPYAVLMVGYWMPRVRTMVSGRLLS